jgi:nucleoside-diphosphate kinase
MKKQRTLSIIKPDAMEKNVVGEIYSRFEKSGLKIVAAKIKQLSKNEVREFYAVHKERSFYAELVEFMSSRSVFIQVLEGNDAIKKNRDLMGSTDPQEAEAGTIRADIAENIAMNAVHGSDTEESAREEISFFFSRSELDSL